MAEESTKKPKRRTERIGKYEILGHIATGGMGVIYKARDTALDRLVALKILPADLAAQQSTLIRFEREAKAAANLRHENIVTIFDVGSDNGTHFIALEFIDGADLQAYLTRKSKLDPEEARQIIIQATKALMHAHEQGIVHRDIKPANFLLTQKGDKLLVKLTDFGLAIRDNDEEFRITRDKTTVGTVDYMSPEQARDSRSADIRSDIYSLGCTFFHLLAGNAPFARGTMPERIVQHMQAPTPDVRRLNANVPVAFVLIINRMLMKKPMDRYQTPAELLYDLEHPEFVVPPTPPVGKLESPRKLEPEPEPEDDEEIEEEKEPKRRPVKRPKPRRPVPLPPPPPVEVEVSASDDSVEFEEPLESASDTSVIAQDEKDTAHAEKSADEKKPKKPGSHLWMYATAGSVGVLGLVLIFALVFGGRPPKREEQKPPEKKPDPSPAVVVAPPPILPPEPDKDKKEKLPPTAVVIDTAAAKMGVPLDLPLLNPQLVKPDRAALRKEFYGTFADFPEPPDDARIVRVGRVETPGPDAFVTLADALAQTKSDEFCVIEIHDNGPIYVQALPPLGQRSLALRAGAGHRPLIVWETPSEPADAKSAAAFVTVERGKLILDNLDFVVQWTGSEPASWFVLTECDFFARGCTFSVESKNAQPVSIVRRNGGPPSLERVPSTWFQCCCVRGPAVTLLNLDGARDHVMIEESLVVGDSAPLIQMRCREMDLLSLHCVRSTLATGHTFLRWQGLTPRDSRPQMQVRLLDSIVSRHDGSPAGGDMVNLADKSNPGSLNWRATNTLYAGWKQLLASGTNNISGTDIDAWRRLLGGFSNVGNAQLDAWPRGISGVEEQPTSNFLPGYSRVAFAAQTGSGGIGCIIGRLPSVPEGWRERVGEQRTVPLVPLTDLAPAIDPPAGKLYTGEVLNLNKINLGEYLDTVSKSRRLAPRVVLHLEGKGACATSPIRVQGVQQLVLYFKPSPDPKNALLLELNSANPLIPLIDMTGGKLDVVGLNVRLSPVTLVPTVVRMRDGDLTMSRCRLQGPLTASAENFKSLITMSNSGAAATSLLLRDNIFTSGKRLIDLHDQVQLRARNNVFLSLGDGMSFEANRPGVPVVHLIDHNTFAIKQNFFTLRTTLEPPVGARALLHANSNLFLHPFADADDGVFLRGGQSWIHQGAWSWQGRYNVYDTRLHAWFAGDNKAPKQTLSSWQRAWGQIAEQNALLDAAPMPKVLTLDGVTQTGLLGQLDRLALRPGLRGDPNQSPPGADLFSLGVLKKKG